MINTQPSTFSLAQPLPPSIQAMDDVLGSEDLLPEILKWTQLPSTTGAPLCEAGGGWATARQVSRGFREAAGGRPVVERIVGHPVPAAADPTAYALRACRMAWVKRDFAAGKGKQVCRPEMNPLVARAHSVAFLPGDNERLLTTADGSVWLWNIARAEGPTQPAVAGNGARGPALAHACPAPDGAQVALGTLPGTFADSLNGSVFLAPLEGRQNHLGRRFEGHTSGIASLAFVDPVRFASGSWDRTVRLWDSRQASATATLLHHQGSVNGLHSAPNGIRLATACEDHALRVYDMRQLSQPLATLREHSDAVCAVAFSPSGDRLASASSDKTVRVWDCAALSESRHVYPHTTAVTTVAFSPTDPWLATACEDGSVHLWDETLSSDTAVAAGPAFADRMAWSVPLAFAPNGHRLAGAHTDTSIRLWECQVTPSRHVRADCEAGSTANVAR